MKSVHPAQAAGSVFVIENFLIKVKFRSGIQFRENHVAIKEQKGGNISQISGWGNPNNTLISP